MLDNSINNLDMGCVCKKEKKVYKNTGESVQYEPMQPSPEMIPLFIVKEESSYNEQSHLPSKVGSYAQSQKHSEIAARKSPEPFRDGFPS